MLYWLPLEETRMKRLTISTIVALVLLISLVVPVSAATGLGISPTSVDITLGYGESVTKEFYAYYFSGTIHVKAVDVPIVVNPIDYTISGSPTLMEITLKNTSSTTGVYNGYLQFTGIDDTNTAISIQIDINVSIIADVVGGGGGVGGDGEGSGDL